MATPLHPTELSGRSGPPPPSGPRATLLRCTTTALRWVELLRARVLEEPRRVIGFGAIALLVSVLALFLMRRAGLGHDAGIDYQVYRWAVRTWLDGGDITVGGPMTSADRVLPWVYPPFALLPLSIPALLPQVAGLWLIYLVDLVSIGVVLYLVARRTFPSASRESALAVTALAMPGTLLLEPVYAAIGLGQVNILLMALVAVDCLAGRPPWPRGLLIGLAAAIKLTPAAFLLFFLVRRDYRAAAVAAGSAAAATLVGFALDRSASMDYWFGSGPAAGVSGSAFHTNQSVMGALARLELPALTQHALWALAALLLVLVTARVLRTAELVHAVLATALLALLLSPTSWSDHWVWVAPGLLAVAGTALRRRSTGWLATGAVIGIAALAATFRALPSRGTNWNAIQHLIGNSYLLIGIAMLLLLSRDAAEPEPRADVLAARD
ncbi:glycosyltransferase family 87 protein [Saccharopolyspora sp. MS10]|uniref:glycosyltransferase family 87 protein n=1 Tax=Saccharopolyspora sp. MS10 TaxID=3385973 RepID=UPI0039A0F0FD